MLPSHVIMSFLYDGAALLLSVQCFDSQGREEVRQHY